MNSLHVDIALTRRVTELTRRAVADPSQVFENCFRGRVSDIVNDLCDNAQLPMMSAPGAALQQLIRRCLLEASCNPNGEPLITEGLCKAEIEQTLVEYRKRLQDRSHVEHSWVIITTNLPSESNAHLLGSILVPFTHLPIHVTPPTMAQRSVFRSLFPGLETAPVPHFEHGNIVISYQVDESMPDAMKSFDQFNHWARLWDKGDGFRRYNDFVINVSWASGGLATASEPRHHHISSPTATSYWMSKDPQFHNLPYFLQWVDDKVKAIPPKDATALEIALEFISYAKNECHSILPFGKLPDGHRSFAGRGWRDYKDFKFASSAVPLGERQSERNPRSIQEILCHS